MPKISELTEATALTDGDDLLIVQAGQDKRVGVDTLRNYIFPTVRWRPLLGTKYTTTPASSSRISMSDTSDMHLQWPIRYTYDDETYGYGIITAISANTYVDIAGLPLDIGQLLTEVAVGLPELCVHKTFYVSGAYGTATGAIGTEIFRWQQSRAYLVKLYATHGSTSGTAPKINVSLGSSSVFTSAIQLAGASVWVESSAVAVFPVGYIADFADDFQIVCAATGTGSNLTVTCVFILE